MRTKWGRGGADAYFHVAHPMIAMIGWQKACPPFTSNGIAVRPLRVRSGWGMDRDHRIAHRIDVAGAIWTGTTAQMGARWLCPSGTSKLVPLGKPTEAVRTCSTCATSRQPTVYLCWAGDQVLYIGSSGNVANRIRSHERRSWFKDVTHVEIRPCNSLDQARAEEARLIYALQPRANVRGKKRLVVAA